jgi:transketolase
MVRVLFTGRARASATVPPMVDLPLIPASAFALVREGGDDDERLALLADIARHNALVAVKAAGSGHLGSSFSALDLVVHLLCSTLDPAHRGFDDPERDVLFSSKGHDVPGLYAVLHGLGLLPPERLRRLRRLGGLDGHPDVCVPGIEANSGSLGMGLSKGRGIALAKRMLDRAGRVVVITGDGELQEGQNWEALQAAAHDRIDTLWAIVDRNEVQSDQRTEDVLALGDLEAKLRAFGWQVARCDGHDHAALRMTFRHFTDERDGRPKALIAETIKGAGVSFMEHPQAMADGLPYRWHAGAPDDEHYLRARAELVGRVESRSLALGVCLPPFELGGEAATSQDVVVQGEPESGAGMRPVSFREDAEYVADAYGAALVELGAEVPELVVLDADLASDCRVRGFAEARPSRFVEVGIAEQDMVSAAAGMARHGLIPVVNSFASFLAARANEQIYNQASEGSKVVYAMHYAGLIPAGPGKSHQSIRDVSLLGSLPGMTIVQPGSGDEARALTRWAVSDAPGTVAIRLAIGPSPRRIPRLDGRGLEPGVGTTLVDGDAALVLAYGPVLLHEALCAAEAVLQGDGLAVRVVAMPWLNVIDVDWLNTLVDTGRPVLVVEDHAPVGALGDAIRRVLTREIHVVGVDGWPVCGTPPEALRAHGLDAASLAERLRALVRNLS